MVSSGAERQGKGQVRIGGRDNNCSQDAAKDEELNNKTRNWEGGEAEGGRRYIVAAAIERVAKS